MFQYKLKVLKLKIMATLENHTLLYDTSCPLCAAYTKGFVASGMLGANGRCSYEEGIANYSHLLDSDRARNEIALVDTEKGSVMYGIESMNYVITHSLPFLKPVLNNAAVLFFLKKFYAFISYNRKVIAPSPGYLQQRCVPDFNIPYRLAYLALSAILTAMILSSYSRLLHGVVPASNPSREYMIAAGQIFFQANILLAFKPTKKLLFDYLGNMMTVSLIGSLLLLPLLILNHYTSIHPFLAPGWFFAVVLYLFLLHRRRVGYIQAPVLLSYTWVLYRVIVLLIIL